MTRLFISVDMTLDAVLVFTVESSIKRGQGASVIRLVPWLRAIQGSVVLFVLQLEILLQFALKICEVLLHMLDHVLVLEVRDGHHSFDAQVRHNLDHVGVFAAHLASPLRDLPIVAVMEWLTLLEFAHFVHASFLLLGNLLWLAIKFDITWLSQVVRDKWHVQMAQFWALKVGKGLHAAIDVFVVGLSNVLDRWTLVFIFFLTSPKLQATSKRARRGHPVEASLDELSIDVALFGSAGLLHHDLILDYANSDLAHNRVRALEQAILELIVIEAGLGHLTHVKVIDAQIFVCLQLGAKILVEPGQLEVLFKTVGCFLVVEEVAIQISKLLVSHHLVLKLMLLLTLVLQATENF